MWACRVKKWIELELDIYIKYVSLCNLVSQFTVCCTVYLQCIDYRAVIVTITVVCHQLNPHYCIIVAIVNPLLFLNHNCPIYHGFTARKFTVSLSVGQSSHVVLLLFYYNNIIILIYNFIICLFNLLRR